MHGAEGVRTAEAWRDRIAGRVALDRSSAETAVRGAYSASGLREPLHILWAGGPREAAQAVAFINSPPCVLWRKVVTALAAGILFWLGLAFEIDLGHPAGQPLPGTALISAFLAGGAMVLWGWRGIPLPPSLTVRLYSKEIILASIGGFLAMAASLPAVEWAGGLLAQPVPVAVALGLVTAAAGALPAAVLALRLKRVYAELPETLRILRIPKPVARALERGQQDAWRPYRQAPAGPRPHESLLDAHRAVLGYAMMLQRASAVQAQGVPDAIGFGRMRRTLPWDAEAQIVGMPGALNGLEASSRAAAVDRVGASAWAARIFANLAFHVDALYPFSSVAICLAPPLKVGLDAEARPQSEDGPALAWADGTEIFAWHGRLLPPDVFDPRLPITLKRIEREPDPVRQHVFIERYGLGRYMQDAGAREVQRDECGALYRLDMFGREPAQAVCVVNHTPEPDGSYRRYWLRVPPTMTTAREAVAWTFDLPVTQYALSVQS